MNDFSLIRNLNTIPEQTQAMTEGIEYAIYEITTHTDGVMEVKIPTRECRLFEAALAQVTFVYKSDVKRLLRTHRGFQI